MRDVMIYYMLYMIIWYIKPIKVICSKFSEAIKLRATGPELRIFGEKSFKLENNIFSSVNTEWILNGNIKQQKYLQTKNGVSELEAISFLYICCKGNQVIIVTVPWGQIIMVLGLPKRRDQLPGLSGRY